MGKKLKQEQIDEIYLKVFKYLSKGFPSWSAVKKVFSKETDFELLEAVVIISVDMAVKEITKGSDLKWLK